MKAAVFDIGGTFVKHGIYEDGVLKDVLLPHLRTRWCGYID